MERRTFLLSSAGAALMGATTAWGATPPSNRKEPSAMIWANLIHLSYNMWCDWDNPKNTTPYINYVPELRFDETLWNDLVKQMAASGVNMVVIDLGDAIRYESHPEIAVKNAWSADKLRQELAKVRTLGIEPIPKLNFSCGHDAWLGPYSRCVSTPKYYEVCTDLIKEVVALFDKPRFFHLGMDEEDFHNQKQYAYAQVRQFDLWWHDFLFLVEQVEKQGARAWIWSDYCWDNKEVFLKRMPKTVIQSNWYYDTDFSEKAHIAVKTYGELAEAGYDQIPTGSNWTSPESFGLTVNYCRKIIPENKLMGFFQTPWKPTLEACRQHHMDAIAQMQKARESIG